MKTKKLFFLIFFGIIFSNLNAQTLFVRPITGIQTDYIVSDIEKITFNSNDLIFTNTSGSNETFLISELRYLNFEDLTLKTTSQDLKVNLFYIYPNPVSSVLNISKFDPKQNITHLAILSMEGRLLLEPNLLNTNIDNVSVNSLPQGTYLCRITSNKITQTIKFLKQ